MGNKTKGRLANAYRAMKDIGINEDRVAPVLETLLQLYEENWALIEEDNYRTLADAIFERDEAEVEEHPRENIDNEGQYHLEGEDREVEEPERPLKKLKRKYVDGEPSSFNASNTSMHAAPRAWPKEEPDELSETHCTKVNGTQKNAERKGNQPSSSNSLVHENGDLSHPTSISKSQQSAPRKNAPRLPSHSMTLRDRSTGAATPQNPSKNKRPVPRRSSPAIQLKERKVEPETALSPEKKKTGNHALLKPKDELITGVMPSLGVSFTKSRIVMVYVKCQRLGSLPLSSETVLLEESTAHQSASEINTDGTVTTRNNAKLETSRGECTSTLEIASSLSGEVKLSLSYKLAPERPNFHMPSREAVLKFVEDKCISPKSLDSNTSLMGIMKETCEHFLELVTRSPIADVRGANGLVYSRSCTKVPQPNQKKLSSPLNGMNGGSKLDAEAEFVINRGSRGNCAEEMDGQPQLTSQMIKSIHNVVDIAKGQEKFAISLVNEVNDERPPSFCYIRQNAIFQNAYANFSLARIGEKNCSASCSGDCLSLSPPCECSYETRGDFAYTADGLIKEELLQEFISMNKNPKEHCQYICKECPLERSKSGNIVKPCKGHLVRNFVKECWIKCGCDMQCGNRVVQRGISRRLQVFMTPEGKGWGLRTLEDLPKGAFVCEYVGEVLTNAELFERVSRKPRREKHSYPVLLDADWCAEGVLKDEEALCLDATYYGNVARFINHKCDDWNLVEIPVEVETPDHHYYHLAFFTSREVKAMEELTWDYGIDFDDHNHPIKAFRCQCGSEFCRYKNRTAKPRARKR